MIVINPIFSTAEEITQKKLETYNEYCKIVQWGRQNPDQFIDKFLAVTLNDAQRYGVMNAWPARMATLVCSRSFGKSFLINKIVNVLSD